jgi:hypothetical protein
MAITLNTHFPDAGAAPNSVLNLAPSADGATASVYSSTPAAIDHVA